MQKKSFLGLIVASFVMCGSPAKAQTSQQNELGMQSNTKSLSEQIKELSQQVSELQTKVREQGVDASAMRTNGNEQRRKMSMGTPLIPQNNLATQAPQMGMMAGMMSMMNSMMSGMGGMAGAAPMGQAASMGISSFLSELPGFPGASHIYHIGATNFFLDHPQHITLSLEQQSRLGEIRSTALLTRSDFNRRIQETEEQLWLLTASDQPNFANIETKVRESEKLQADSRLAFIKNVGEAAKLLSGEQRKALLGQLSPPAPVTTAPSQVMGDM